MTRLNDDIDYFVYLHTLLGEFGTIERQQLLPNKERETNSHHSFSLALICYELSKKYAPELDTEKVLLYSLIHDLPEIFTGDVNTLIASKEELIAKQAADEIALKKTEILFFMAPNIISTLKEYENKTTPEALFVWWIDKIMPALAHLHNGGILLKEFKVDTVEKLSAHKERLLEKLAHYGKPPECAKKIVDECYTKMYEMLERWN